MTRAAFLTGALLTLTACSGGSDGPTGTSGVASVKMNANAISIFPGQTEQLTASALDGSGAAVAGAPAPTWRSANSSIATVSTSGVVTGVGLGQTDVTATIDGKVGTTRVTVGQAPLAVTVSMPGNSFAPFTSTIRLGGTVTFAFPQTPHNVIFTAKPGAPTDIQVTSNIRIGKTFNTLGTFPFDCTLHPGMSGEVVVVP
ncbi:MAG: Ig-like domain-containing protein [Gemmatimonadaceae bacterium]